MLTSWLCRLLYPVSSALIVYVHGWLCGCLYQWCSSDNIHGLMVSIISLINANKLENFWSTGYSSFRQPGYGSFFIQALCSELEEKAFLFNFTDILIFMHNRIALGFQVDVPGDINDGAKQMPMYECCLTKFLKFTKPKVGLFYLSLLFCWPAFY